MDNFDSDKICGCKTQEEMHIDDELFGDNKPVNIISVEDAFKKDLYKKSLKHKKELKQQKLEEKKDYSNLKKNKIITSSFKEIKLIFNHKFNKKLSEKEIIYYDNLLDLLTSMSKKSYNFRSTDKDNALKMFDNLINFYKE